ncbi:hypothetical protein D9M68_417110 [compost metagenome]
MVQRAQQGEGVVAVAFHLQGEHGIRARRGHQGIADPRIGDRHTVGGQRRHCLRHSGHAELRAGRRAYQQLTEVAGDHSGLGVAVGDAMGKLVLVHLADNRRGVFDAHRQGSA